MYICKDCFEDEELRSEVESNAIIDGCCMVCGSIGKLIDFSEFYDFLMPCFHFLLFLIMQIKQL